MYKRPTYLYFSLLVLLTMGILAHYDIVQAQRPTPPINKRMQSLKLQPDNFHDLLLPNHTNDLTTSWLRAQLNKTTELPKDRRKWLQNENLQMLSQSMQQHLLWQYLPGFRATLAPEEHPTSLVGESFFSADPTSENLRVNDPSRDTGAVRAQSGTSATTFGKTIVVSFNDGAGLTENNLAGVSVSPDGGQTWRQQRLPIPSSSAGDNTFNLGDGVVSVDTKGTFYYAMIGFNKTNQSYIGVSRSTDNGTTWSLPLDASTTATNDKDFQDKEWLTVDRQPQSKFKNRVYLSWTSFQNNGVKILFAYAKKGKKFVKPKVISGSTRKNGFVQGSMVAIGPNGEVYLAWLDADNEGLLGNVEIKFAKSLDGGQTFSAPIGLGVFNMPGYPANGVFSGNSFPSLAVDLSSSATKGNIYITFAVRGAKGDRADVMMARSTDGGTTFLPARKLNDDTDTAEQILPSIAVADDGAVAASWYDRRNDPLNFSLLDIFATVSTDGGATFAPNRPITTASWPLVPTPFGLRGGYHGDYAQLTTMGNQFLFNWADDRSGLDSDVYLSLKTAADLARPKDDFVVTSRNSFGVIKPGGSTSFVIIPQNLAGSGDFSYTASPNIDGLAIQFNDSSAMPGAGILMQVSTTEQVKPGQYFITVTATRGTLARSTAIRLTVIDNSLLARTPQNLSKDRSGSSSPFSVIDNDGNINIAWLDDTSGLFSIAFTRSTDGGKTFAPPVLLPRSNVFYGIPILLADTNNIYILHLEVSFDPQLLFETKISRSTDGGKTFSPDKTVFVPDNLFVITETAQLDSDGSIHLAVLTNSVPDNQTPFITYDAKSVDNGNVFTLNKIVASNSPLSTPILFVEGDGQSLRSIFVDSSRDNRGLFITRSTDGGATFAPPIPITTDLTDLSFATAYFLSDNQTNIILGKANFDTNKFGLFYTRTDKDGKFRVPIAVNGQAQTVSSGGFSADEVGNVVVAFEGSTQKANDPNFSSKIFYCTSIDSGLTFTPVQSFMPIGGGDFSPVVIRDFNEGYSIIWLGLNRGVVDVLYSFSSDQGRTFSSPVNLSSDAGISVYSDFAFDKDGKLQLLLEDNSPGSFDIFRTKLGN